MRQTGLTLATLVEPSKVNYAAKLEKFSRSQGEWRALLEPEALDELDTACESLLLEAGERQTDMEAQTEAVYEAVKARFLGFLERLFEGLRELGARHSSFAKFRVLVEHFQDCKDSFETEANAQTEAGVLGAVKNLLRFDRLDESHRFEHGGSLQEPLRRVRGFAEEFAEKMQKDLEGFEKRHVRPRFEARLLSDEELLKTWDLELRLGQEDFLTRTAERPHLRFVSEAMERFKTKVLEQRARAQRGKEPPQVPARSGAAPKICFRRAAALRGVVKCVLLHHSSRCLLVSQSPPKWELFLEDLGILFVGDPAPEPARHSKKKGRKPRGAPGRGAPVVRPKNILGAFERPVEALEVSPRDRHVAVELKGEGRWRFFKLDCQAAPPRLVALSFGGKDAIRRFAFVDAAEGELLVFVDAERSLRAWNLDKGRLELTWKGGERFRSVHYVDPGHVLVVTEAFRFAVLSLKSGALSPGVALEDNLGAGNKFSFSSSRFALPD